MSSSLLEEFREAYRNLQLLPLHDLEKPDKFYVPYGSDVLDELEQVVEDCADVNNKVIFTGHRGCGKSTLLWEFRRKLEDRYFVVFFSIAELIELSDVNQINILFAIAVQMREQAEQKKVPIPPEIRQDLDNWFVKKTQITTESIKAQVGVGINFFNFLKNQLQTDASLRSELKQEFERKTSELIAQVNKIANEIESATQQELLIIIDDLDKLEPPQARQIFHDHIRSIFKPQFRIIFTVPIAILREIDVLRTIETESNNQIISMGVARLYPKPDQTLLRERRQSTTESRRPVLGTLASFSDILYKRLPPNLIEHGTVETMMLLSGGVLRELIRIAQRCCAKCLQQLRREPELRELKITDAILAEVINDFRNDFAMPLNYAHYIILAQIYLHLTPSNKTDTDWTNFLSLLHGLYIMEYRNGDLWYDVHPIVVELLEKRGMLLPS